MKISEKSEKCKTKASTFNSQSQTLHRLYQLLPSIIYKLTLSQLRTLNFPLLPNVCIFFNTTSHVLQAENKKNLCNIIRSYMIVGKHSKSFRVCLLWNLRKQTKTISGFLVNIEISIRYLARLCKVSEQFLSLI